jgi:DNA-directed RNA polymerase-3 subunit RPC5
LETPTVPPSKITEDSKLPTVAMADTSSPDDDPIVATYSVFVKPPLPAHRKLLVLQHPNMHSPAPSALQPPTITQIRVKPKSGMIEVDVPLDCTSNYDKAKGMRWGSVLQRSMDSKKGGSLGLAGGFGIGAPPPRPSRRAGGGDNGAEGEGPNWNEAVRMDRVLRTQTLGGLWAEGKDAQYMVGVFHGSKRGVCVSRMFSPAGC